MSATIVKGLVSRDVNDRADARTAVVNDMRRNARTDAEGVISGLCVDALEKRGLVVVARADLEALWISFAGALRGGSSASRRYELEAAVAFIRRPR